MKIVKIIGREIFDSRGWPTIACELILEEDLSVTASIPAGLSRGTHEAYEIRDGGKRLFGKGVLQAIDRLETTIGPALVGKEPNVIDADLRMIEIDGTPNKSYLGANAMLAASIAVAKAQAFLEGLEPFELIAYLMGLDTVTLPYPMVNVINGGLHADNNLFIQEFMIVPIGAQNVRSSLEIVAVVFQEIKNELKKRNLLTNVGDEGGFAPNLDSETEALDIIVEALDKAGQDSCVIALDVAATQYYDAQTGLYRWHDKLLSSYELIAFYENLAEDYPIYSLEDGLAQEDIMGWQELMNRLGDRVQIVGDDLFATNYNRITQGIENGLATGVIIKPNQIGTVTEALQAIKLCKQYQLDAIVSHRSSETEDTFIVDLAVGANVGQLKAGGFCRGERIAKYNRLLTIEDHLIRLLMES